MNSAIAIVGLQDMHSSHLLGTTFLVLCLLMFLPFLSVAFLKKGTKYCTPWQLVMDLLPLQVTSLMTWLVFSSLVRQASVFSMVCLMLDSFIRYEVFILGLCLQMRDHQ